MTEECQLKEVLATNPFLKELDNWERDLRAFSDGQQNLEELKFVLQSDANNFDLYQNNYARRSGKKDTFLHPEILPKPFIGDPRAPIWYLLLNPGYCDWDRFDNLGFLSLDNRRHLGDGAGNLSKRQSLMLQQFKLEEGMPFYLLDSSFDTLQGVVGHKKDGGYRWWRTTFFGANCTDGFLLPECGVRQDAESVGKKIFVLECCPYHSCNFDEKVLWERGEYMKFWMALISWAVRTDRKFIVRSVRIDRLLEMNHMGVGENNSLQFVNWRNVSLTIRNLKGLDCVKEAICKALSAN